MRNKGLSTSMGIALTLLLGGLITQITDYFEIFGHNSVIPLIIGLVIVVIGVSFFLILRWSAREK